MAEERLEVLLKSLSCSLYLAHIISFKRNLPLAFKFLCWRFVPLN